MRFGPLPLSLARGAILAHGCRLPDGSLKKGRVLTDEDLARLAGAGYETVTAALLEPGDVGEDAAAGRIARAVSGPGLTVSAAFTGRVNLYAHSPGLVLVDAVRLERINLLDEAVTIATLPAHTPVAIDQMVATIKIIPFAAPGGIVTQAEDIAREAGPLLRVAGWRRLTAGLVQTTLPGTKPAMLDKTAAVTAGRLEALGATLAVEHRVPHEPAAVAGALDACRAAGCDLFLLVGASAITDRRDVLPDGLERAGGTVLHFGMPVDPGNLLLLGRYGGGTVLGLPGCARSPKLNGVDWVLHRLAAA